MLVTRFFVCVLDEAAGSDVSELPEGAMIDSWHAMSTCSLLV